MAFSTSGGFYNNDYTTYLIGAGASCNALPVINAFPEALKNVIQNVKKLRSQNIENIELRERYDIIIQDLEILLTGCNKHSSVDTYARKFYLNGDNFGYNETKYAITLFFELHRLFTGAFDKRYDAFLSMILKRQPPRFPKNIQIISWNYDYEFEKALLNYITPTNSIEDVYEELNVIHKNGDIIDLNYNEQRFQIVKINGTAGVYWKDGKLVLGYGFAQLFATDNSINDNEQKIFPIINTYIKVKQAPLDSFKPAMSFAWEDGERHDKIVNLAEHILNSTKKLVIVGYSFPQFNTDVDSKILKRFLLSPNSNIFIQDPNSFSIMSRIEDLNSYWTSDKFKIINDLNTFYIPPK